MPELHLLGMASMNKQELKILREFRINARENLTRTSRRTGIPVSTLHDRLRRYEGSLIKRHTALLDFSKLGFALKVMMSIKLGSSKRDELVSFLRTHHRVNSLYKITSGYDVMVEVIFRNLAEYQEFCEQVDSYLIADRQEFFVIEELKQEAFLTQDFVLDMLEEQAH